MTGFTLSVALQLAVLAAPGKSYMDAYRQTQETGRPLLVLVSADWCPACQVLKDGPLSKLTNDGDLEEFAYAVVNSDHEPEMAQKLMTGNSLPQLVLFTQSEKGWERQQLTGGQTEPHLRTFLRNALKRHARFRPRENTTASAE